MPKTLEEVIKEIEGMKGKYAWAADHQEGIVRDEIYDEAIDDIISLLRSLEANKQ